MAQKTYCRVETANDTLLTILAHSSTYYDNSFIVSSDTFALMIFMPYMPCYHLWIVVSSDRSLHPPKDTRMPRCQGSTGFMRTKYIRIHTHIHICMYSHTHTYVRVCEYICTMRTYICVFTAGWWVIVGWRCGVGVPVYNHVKV